jgi:ribonuclease D
MISTGAELKELVSRILQMGSVGLDTEFFWERTFYPRLGVVQLGLPDGSCQLVDAPAIGGFEPGGLQPLGRLLASRRVVKILHDAPQDLAILRRASGSSPRNIFDTRYAAGFAGLDSTTSLGNLLDELFDIRLPKTETRADWLKRPLTSKQVSYAEDDVRHLHAARDELVRRAEERGVADWLREELKSFDDPEAYEDRDPRQQFRRVKGFGRLASREQAVLRELAAWREETARLRDRPRGRVLADKTLVHLARLQPRTIRSLTGGGKVSDRTAQRSGAAILQAVEAGLALDSGDCPPRSPNRRNSSVPGPLVEEGLKMMRSAAEQWGIDQALVATRAEVKALLTAGAAARPEDHRLLRGWREKFVGRELADLPLRFESQ